MVVDELPRDERRKPGLECVHRTTYSVSIGYCHAFLSKMLLCEWAATPKPESTEGGRRVSVLRRQEGAPVLLG